MIPKIIDNDRGGITVELLGNVLRGWLYENDAERQTKMLAAHEYVEGWCNSLARMKRMLDIRLNNCLCEMKPNYDDSIVGFNEAWNIMRECFAAANPPAPEGE